MLYTRKNYSPAGYLSDGIRTYCCGYGKDNTSAWVLSLLNNLHGNVYHDDKPGQEYTPAINDGNIEQLFIMQESTNAVFCFANGKHVARTLMLMGYAIMCPHVLSVALLDDLNDNATNLVTSVARNNNITVCTTMEQVFKYLTTQWQNTEARHILLEREVMV